MAKNATYRCSACQHTVAKFMGKCPNCKAWNTIEEVFDEPTGSTIIGSKTKHTAAVNVAPAQKMSEIPSGESHARFSTGVDEFDRVLGGGVVAGSVILLAGAPGSGKSTLAGAVAHNVSQKKPVLYISGEESAHQIKMRHQRMNAEGKELFLASENDLTKVIAHIDAQKPQLLILDSLQTIASPSIEGRAGSPSQVTEVATVITRIAKSRNIAVLIIGHVTKESTIAGPRMVEHLVDVVLAFEGDEESPLRLLRGIKNRFGAADEVGCFEHAENGLQSVSDPSGLLLGKHSEPVSGVATSIILEGKRALPVEIQALVTSSVLPNPRKVTSGLDASRTIMMQAVLEKHGKERVSDKDVYISTTGGIKVKDPAVDLATIIALATAAKGIQSHPRAVAFGEISLSGEVRKTMGLNRRLAEAVRLGFEIAYVPTGSRELISESISKSGIVVIELKNVAHILTAIAGAALALSIEE